MQLTFDDATEAFRQSFEAWLDEHAPAEAEATERSRSSAHVPAWARRWQRDLFDHGWLVPGNPPEFGGRNATVVEQFVHHEVLARRSIYLSFNPQGLGIVVPSLLAFGTDPQKQRWALPLLRAEITAALGMSEPNAGSDLAGLRTRAVLDGDQFVVNGQKVWTSGAHDADVILAFVRTDPDAPKHKGISALLIPTDLPGVTRRPFGSVIARDELDFNEVFFDDVHVPAENLLGELHGGWGVANGSLGHERSMLWLDYSQRLDEFIDDISLAVPDTDHDRDARFRDCVRRRRDRCPGAPPPGLPSRRQRAARPAVERCVPPQAVRLGVGAAHVGRGRRPARPCGARPHDPEPALQPPAARRVRRQLVRSVPAQLLRNDRRRHLGDPAQHRGRARARPASLSPGAQDQSEPCSDAR